MSNQTESEKLAYAVAALAGTILEIINEKFKVSIEAHAGMQPESALFTVKSTPSEGWVSKKELAKHFNISLRTVDNWIKKGLIPHIRMGSRRLRFKLSEVDEAINRSNKQWGRM